VSDKVHSEYICDDDDEPNRQIYLEVNLDLPDLIQNIHSVVRSTYIEMSIDILERLFICRTCKIKFPDSLSFRAHQLDHTGEPHLLCEICNKKFVSKRDLQRHSQVHTGERLCICDICSKTYSDSSTLGRHKRRIHPKQSSTAPTCEARFECETCK